MARKVTIHVSESYYQSLSRIASASDQSMEILILKAIQAALPILEGLPIDIDEIQAQPEIADEEAPEAER